MAIVNLSGFEQLVGRFVPFVGEVIDFKAEQALDKAVTDLYANVVRLAVMTVQETTAFLWWAAHIASAADDALGYSAEIRDAISRANALEMEVWREWVNVKHPQDLRSLYDTLLRELQRQLDALRAGNQESLKPLWKAIHELQLWRKNTVTPDLKAWNTFYKTWNDTYLPPVRTLTHWLKSPGTFAEWAILPLIAATPSALRKPITQRSATAIESTLMATWQNDPQPVFDAITQWLVAGK